MREFSVHFGIYTFCVSFCPVYGAIVIYCVWSKKGDAGFSGISVGLVHCSSFQFVWIWTGFQLLSSDWRTSSEALSRNHHLLRFLSDLYFLFTSICSPTSVRQFIGFLTTVVMQLLSVTQILRTPKTFSLGGEGASPPWGTWLAVAPEFEWSCCSHGACALVVTFSVVLKVARGLGWFRLDFFLCFLPAAATFVSTRSWCGLLSTYWLQFVFQSCTAILLLFQLIL